MRHVLIAALVFVAGCSEETTNRPPPGGSGGDYDTVTNSCGNDELDGLEPCDGALFRDGAT